MPPHNSPVPSLKRKFDHHISYDAGEDLDYPHTLDGGELEAKALQELENYKKRYSK